MIESRDLKEIGKFQKTHALRGELNALLDIDPEFLTDGNALITDIDGIFVPFYTDSVRTKGSQSFLVKLNGIDSEDEAKPFVNKVIYALKTDLAPFLDVEEDELFDDDDLKDFYVHNDESGETIGKIIHVDSSTNNVLFIVETSYGEEIFIPAVDAFINGIDEESKVIHMTLPTGLIDLNKKLDK